MVLNFGLENSCELISVWSSASVKSVSGLSGDHFCPYNTADSVPSSCSNWTIKRKVAGGLNDPHLPRSRKSTWKLRSSHFLLGTCVGINLVLALNISSVTYFPSSNKIFFDSWLEVIRKQSLLDGILNIHPWKVTRGKLHKRDEVIRRNEGMECRRSSLLTNGPGLVSLKRLFKESIWMYGESNVW